MPELSKQALKVQNNTEFPNNNNGYITPARLRSFNVDMIDSNVNQTVYTADSASFDARINAITGSGGTGSADLTSLNAFTASQEVQNATLATYTGSNDTKWSTLGGQSGSWITESETGSMTVLSSSFALTSSISRNVIVVARNGNASTLAAGTVVHITSAVGDNPIFTTASYDTEALSGNTFGLLRYSSAAGADVEVVVQGVVTGVNTDPTLGYTAGDIVYLSSSGQFTRIQPQAPNQIVTLGQVLRAQQNNGSIYVSINNGWELNELHNVQINSPQTGDLLQYESASYGLWKNKSINGAGITSTSSFNAYTSSNDAKVNSLINATSSYVTETESGSFLVTASFSGNTLTFTKGDASTFGVVIPDISGSTIDTGSFATTGSNTFIGNQVITSAGNTQLDITSTAGGQTNLYLQGPGSNMQAYGDFSFGNNGQYGGSGSVKFIASNNRIEFGADSGIRIGATNGGGNGIDVGYAQLLVRSGSLVLAPAGFSNTTASIAHLSASSNFDFINLVFKNNSNTGTTFITGSNNIFTNPGAPTAGYVRYVGGNSNLFLNSNRDTTISVVLPQITGSAASVSGFRPLMNGNIVLGTPVVTINQSIAPGQHTYNNNTIAGNLTINAIGQVGSGAQLGRLDYTGNTNYGTVTLNLASQSIANINTGASGSARANINNNNIVGTFTYSGPVSASATAQIHTINANNINGTVTLNLQSGSKAYNISNNIINGTLTFTDNTVFAPTLGSTGLLSNTNINGTVALNARASSSFSISNSNINNWTISSDADCSAITTAAARTSVLGASALFGAVGNNILYSGSATGAVGKTLQSVLMAGNNISASVGGGEQALQATAVLGNGLTVYGTGILNSTNSTVGGQNNGSLFAGRWNVDTLPRAGNAETVFAIGTGTSGSAGIVRKTGFLIDSGSNIFAEGTFNMSGSITASDAIFNGDVIINPNTSTKLNGNTDIGAFLYVNSGITMDTDASITWLGSSPIDYTFSGSVDSRINAINSVTGTFATTGSNSFVGNQYITGAAYVSGALGQIDLDTVNGFLSIYNYDPGTSVSVNASSETASISMTAFGDRVSIGDGGADWFYATNDGLGNFSSVNSERDIIVSGSVTITDVLQLGQLDPLPGGADGQLAVSASNLYFYSGSAWNLIAFA